MKPRARWRDILTYDFLFEEHVNKKKSMNQIAKELGCDHKTISHYMHYSGVPYQQLFFPDRKMQAHPGWLGYEDISMSQFGNMRNNARNRGIEFNVTIEQLWEQYEKQDRKCALSGVPIGFISCHRGNASLDRIDSSKRYEIGNVWWLHMDVNYAKQSLSVREFVDLCRNVTRWNAEDITR